MILEFYWRSKRLQNFWGHVSYDLTGNNENKVIAVSGDENGAVKFTPGVPEWWDIKERWKRAKKGPEKKRSAAGKSGIRYVR